MPNHDRIPAFGSRIPGRDYVSRPSAYVILRDRRGHVAVVRTAIGVFLPGGGQRPDETPEEAAIRETREECGLEIEVVGHIGVADQFVHAEREGRYFEKRSTFLRGAPVGRTASTEPDHELRWLPETEAARALSHESHRWAIVEERRPTKPLQRTPTLRFAPGRCR